MEREQTTLRIPAELMKKLRAQAERNNISVNALILMILSAEQSRLDLLDRERSPNREYGKE